MNLFAKGNKDPNVKAMVLIGAGRSFIAGADIRQFGKGAKRMGIGERVVDVLEQGDKPIVAAIHGFALGGGLETAMACNYRIAKKSTRVGLPEVLIGLLPGGAGTQRLPRLVGPKIALDMITSGRHVPAEEAKGYGILDALVDDKADLRGEAIKFAKSIAEKKPMPVVSKMSTRFDEYKNDPGMFDAMRKSIERKAKGQPAPFACISAVEAAVTLPYEKGLERERELFAPLENSDASKGLALCLLRRAAGRTSARSAGGCESQEDRKGRGDRRRHHGWRHRHELRRLRRAGENPRLDAGSARPRHEAGDRQLCSCGQARQHHAGADGRAAEADRAGAQL